MSNYNVSETQVVLDEANFVVVGQAKGRAQTTQILGIGGLSPKALKGNAIADMYENSNLSGSQTIINVILKQRISGLTPIFFNIEYCATGTIIEFVNDSTPKRHSTNNIATASENSMEYNADTIKIDKNEFDIHVVENPKEGKVEYNGVKAITVVTYEDMVVLASINGKNGTWNEAMEYCKSLGDGWRLPSTEEFKLIQNKLSYDSYWTYDEVNEKRAKVFVNKRKTYGYFDTSKTSIFYIQPIAIVRAEDLK